MTRISGVSISTFAPWTRLYNAAFEGVGNPLWEGEAPPEPRPDGSGGASPARPRPMAEAIRDSFLTRAAPPGRPAAARRPGSGRPHRRAWGRTPAHPARWPGGASPGRSG